MPFDRILGHTRPLTIVRRMLRSGRIPHAFLFTGTGGTGKHTVAMAVASALNCRQSTDDFCGSCASCRKTASGVHPDILQIEPEKDIITIDRIRDLQRALVFSPVEGAWRTVIIDRAECMNKEAANCLLKTLEEPPPSTVIVLVAHFASRLLPTIVSRCQRIRFAPLGRGELLQLLGREGVAPETAGRIAACAHGSMQRARHLMDGTLVSDVSRLAAAMFSQAPPGERLDLAAELAKSADRAEPLLLLLLEWLRDILAHEHGAGTAHGGSIASCLPQLPERGTIALPRIVKKIEQARALLRDLAYNINIQLGIESLLLS